MIQFLLSLLSISYVNSFHTTIPITHKLIKSNNKNFIKKESNISMLDLGNCVRQY